MIESRLQHYWRKACEYDGISPDRSLSVFSNKNPYARTYSLLLRAYFRLLRNASVQFKRDERVFHAEITGASIKSVAIYLGK
jgi:hypothetical protein